MFFEPAVSSPVAIAIRCTTFNTLVDIAEHPVRAVTIISTTFGALVTDTNETRIAIIVILATAHTYVIFDVTSLTRQAVFVTGATLEALVGIQIAVHSRWAVNHFTATLFTLVIVTNQPGSEIDAIGIFSATENAFIIYTNLSGRAVAVVLTKRYAAVVDAFKSV